MVARGVLYVASVPRWRFLVAPEAESLAGALLRSVSPHEKRFQRGMKRSAFLRGLIAFVERLVAPGILLHYALRKRFLEEEVTRALADGFRQVVILGAGLDTLGLRLHERHGGVRFVEIDRAATQQYKRRLLGQSAEGEETAVSRANLHLLAADLGERPLPEILRDCPAFDRALETLFLAEGVLMYLAEADVRRLFAGVRDSLAAPARCRVAFTFLEVQPNGEADFAHSGRLLRFWLRRRGEPFLWGIGQADLPDWLAPFGLRVTGTIATPEALRARYFPEEPLLGSINGDLIGVAERI